MPIDFSKLAKSNALDSVIDPQEVFSALPRQEGRYQYLRDVQADVLRKWFSRRKDAALSIKMNTGSGKTTVGLLILKSSLNEGCGPAVYVAPDLYLAQQVIFEAKALGLEVTDEPASPRFHNGKAILVTNIYRIFNGKSVFGIGGEGSKISIGSIVIDDVHACLATTEEQFSIKLPMEHEAYAELWKLFKGDLAGQSSTRVLDIEAGDPSVNMPVPYWAWISKCDQVAAALHTARTSDELKFSWPLLRDCLKFCTCVFGGKSIEISPHCIPVDQVPSFVKAKRKVFMSATVADDSILVSHFNVQPEALENIVTPENANDIGERMILVPQELNPKVEDEDVKSLCASLAAKHNVVVIVPTKKRADFWQDVAKLTLSATELQAGVKKLKEGHVGLVVLIDKYDGIDLPYDAARVLVIDGLPKIYRKISNLEQTLLDGTDEILNRRAQQLEQGMGRGIRASDDYCVVFLMGRSLIEQLYNRGTVHKFTPPTKAQFDLSSTIAEQVRGKNIDAIAEIVQYALRRDQDWVKAAKSVVIHLKYETKGSVNGVTVGRRIAFNMALRGMYPEAEAQMQLLINSATDRQLTGWLKQQLADYKTFTDPVSAQEIQRSAVGDNVLLLRPLQGVHYTRIREAGGNQAAACIAFVKSRFKIANSLLVWANDLINRLVFEPETANDFEAAMKELAGLIGFEGQRPESETGRGPDVLWSMGNHVFAVIECKNGAIVSTITKDYCNQLSGSINWFVEIYGKASVTPIMVHPVTVFERSASPLATVCIINQNKLEELRNGIKGFTVALSDSFNKLDTSFVADRLVYFGLISEAFVLRYTTRYTKQR